MPEALCAAGWISITFFSNVKKKLVEMKQPGNAKVNEDNLGRNIELG